MKGVLLSFGFCFTPSIFLDVCNQCKIIKKAKMSADTLPALTELTLLSYIFLLLWEHIHLLYYLLTKLTGLVWSKENQNGTYSYFPRPVMSFLCVKINHNYTTFCMQFLDMTFACHDLFRLRPFCR